MTTAQNFQENILSLATPQNSAQKEAYLFWKTHDLPTKKQELWRYTNLSDIYKHTWALPQDNLNSVTFPTTIPQGFSLKEIPRSTVPCHHDTPFMTINQLLQPHTFALMVAADTTIPQPIHIHHRGAPNNTIINSHLSLCVGKNSQVTIIETFEDDTQNVYLTNSIMEVSLEENSSITYIRNQAQNIKSYHFGNTRVTQKAHSKWTSYVQTTGSAIARHNLDIQLTEPESHAIALGAYMTKGKQVADFYTHIDHLTHHTTSEQIYKGILNDSSTATFHGGVHVHSNAHNSNSQQLNQNILLSNKALINTKPLLEIDNDDVKCAHGATIGQLNPEELFYLESRAINPQSAKKMILQGFLNDLFNRLPANPAIQNLYKELSL